MINRSRILELARNKHTSDSKDKIFALYDLIDSLNLPISPPNYDQPIHEIYEGETRSAIQEDGILEVRYCVSPIKQIAYLPSWVPNWSDSISLRCTSRWHFASSAKAPAWFMLSERPTSLVVQGKALDVISTVTTSPLETVPEASDAFLRNV